MLHREPPKGLKWQPEPAPPQTGRSFLNKGHGAHERAGCLNSFQKGCEGLHPVATAMSLACSRTAGMVGWSGPRDSPSRTPSLSLNPGVSGELIEARAFDMWAGGEWRHKLATGSVSRNAILCPFTVAS